MSSAIFYRFRSQKDPSRILFDGTGITVFDLKKEIISVNKLGTGLDFDLKLYNADTDDEYADDTQVIPRSTAVVARRSPAVRNNKGTASRYVTGKPRILKNNAQIISTTKQPTSTISTSASNASNNASTEEDKIKMMFKNQDEQWKDTQVSMSNATPIYNTKQTNNTEDLPPPGYMCYRCGGKDHWIKNCPTNDDPNWEGKRIKRTTGIPKSYLKTIDKPTDDDDTQNYMITEEGKYVVAIADSKSWDAYQRKNISTQQPIKIDDETLLDPISRLLLHKPMKTPCCDKTYSRETIEDTLLENDFVCPNCGKEDVLLDTLIKDTETQSRIDVFLKENEKKLGIKRGVIDDESGEVSKRPKLDLPSRPEQGFVGMPVPFMPFPMMPLQSNQK